MSRFPGWRNEGMMNAQSDRELLEAARRGNREAFASLVSRHQQMVCAIAYSRTGSYAASEDVAQDTFLAAWRQIAKADLPENFRAWLCGTVRNLAARFHRDHATVAPLTAEAVDDRTPPPSFELAAREEEAFVWSALERLPETYRDPLVLFYRQEQSVREVAASLDLSEEAVRQRLTRGRTMLQDAVRARVETALRGSAPGKAFTIAVIAAIPAATGTAQAAAVGAAAVKGGSLLTASTLAALASGLSGILIGAAGAWMGIKSSLDDAESATERRFLIRTGIGFALLALFGSVGMIALMYFSGAMLPRHPILWGISLLLLVLVFTGGMTGLGIRTRLRVLEIRRAERIRRGLNPEESSARFREYRSRATFLGLPLIHVNYGCEARIVHGSYRDPRRFGLAKGWIAIGNVAVSPFLAIGGVAIGGIAVGGVGIGVFCFSGFGLGAIVFSGAAAGILAMGGMALGYIAYGGIAWAWHIAMGGCAVARNYALGGYAQADHANDAAARALAQHSQLLITMDWLMSHIWLTQLLIVLPIMIVGYRLQRRMRLETGGEFRES